MCVFTGLLNSEPTTKHSKLPVQLSAPNPNPVCNAHTDKMPLLSWCSQVLEQQAARAAEAPEACLE